MKEWYWDPKPVGPRVVRRVERMPWDPPSWRQRWAARLRSFADRLDPSPRSGGSDGV